MRNCIMKINLLPSGIQMFLYRSHYALVYIYSQCMLNVFQPCHLLVPPQSTAGWMCQACLGDISSPGSSVEKTQVTNMFKDWQDTTEENSAYWAAWRTESVGLTEKGRLSDVTGDVSMKRGENSTLDWQTKSCKDSVSSSRMLMYCCNGNGERNRNNHVASSCLFSARIKTESNLTVQYVRRCIPIYT